MSNTRQITHTRARALCADLTAVGVTLPTAVTEALAALDAVDTLQPATIDPAAVAAVYATGDKKKAEAAALDLTTHPARRAAWEEGRILAGIAVLHTVQSHGDHIVTALAEQAAPLIDTVTAAASIETHDLSSLIREGRTADAELAARHELNAADLAHLYALRAKVTKGAEYDVNGWDCGVWRDPRPVRDALAGRSTAITGPAELYTRGVRAGGQLWFPTPGEAVHAAGVIARAESARADDEQARAWQRATGAKPRKLSA